MIISSLNSSGKSWVNNWIIAQPYIKCSVLHSVAGFLESETWRVFSLFPVSHCKNSTVSLFYMSMTDSRIERSYLPICCSPNVTWKWDNLNYKLVLCYASTVFPLCAKTQPFGSPCFCCCTVISVIVLVPLLTAHLQTIYFSAFCLLFCVWLHILHQL